MFVGFAVSSGPVGKAGQVCWPQDTPTHDTKTPYKDWVLVKLKTLLEVTI